MSDTFITIIAIFLAAILMFIFPLMTLADRNDDITQLTVQTATTEFIDEIRRTGKLTEDHYNNFLAVLSSTGNAYDVELVFQILDEIPGKKDTIATPTVIGENVYYSVYTTQIEHQLGKSPDHTYYLKEGDIVSATVKKTSSSLAETLRGVFYKLTGNQAATIIGSSSGTVPVNGK